MAAIRKSTLEAVLLAARNTYPDEFIALLSSKGKNKVADEFVLLPAIYGKSFSSIRLDLLPLDKSILGSVHSHPGPNASPSSADKRAFRHMGEMHLILAAPFNLESARAFDANGKEFPLEVLE